MSHLNVCRKRPHKRVRGLFLTRVCNIILHVPPIYFLYAYMFKEYVFNIILYYITRKFRRHFLVWKLEIIQYRKLKRKSRWKYLNLCDLLCIFYYYVMQINCVESFERCAATVHCAVEFVHERWISPPFTIHIYIYNINITCTYKSATLLFTFPLLEITLIRFWYTSRPVFLNA